MKLKTFLFITFLCICSTLSWGQTVLQTWNLTPTMTATLNSLGVLTISTTASAEAMPNDQLPSAPWYDVRSSILSVVINDKVTSIRSFAFEDCTNLKSISIPNSVTNIGYSAFVGCTSLTSIIIPNSVTNIGDGAFAACHSLNSITISNSVTNIGKATFMNCHSLNSVTIPNSVTSIGEQSFLYCINLTSITIPNSVISIERDAFGGCSSLTSVTIPNSVTDIGSQAFAATGLISVSIPNSVENIGRAAFSSSGLTDVTVAWAIPLDVPDNPVMSIFFINLPAATLHVPGGTKGLYEVHPFWGQFGTIDDETRALQTWQLTQTMTATLDNAGVLTISTTANAEAMPNDQLPYAPWYDVRSSIQSVMINDKVTSIRSFAFDDCTNLISISIPNSVTRIGSNAFRGCTSLTSITIPNSVTSIEPAFSGCSGLLSIEVDNANPAYASENGVLFDKAKTVLIWYPEGKTGSYTIPNSVTSIGSSAFDGCTGLTYITIPNSVTSIEYGTFSNCTSLTSITIPNSVTSIGYRAFTGCTSLNSVTIGNSVTNIGYNAFAGCTSLTSITIPNSVTSIEGGAFSNCTSLTSITIPNSVTSIGGDAFSNCTSLTSVTIGNSVTSIRFSGCSSLLSIEVDNANPVLSSENGVLFDKAKTVLIWYPEGKTGSYTIPNSVTGIGVMAFSDCTSLTSITIPNSVTYIGGAAFAVCSGLTSITIPNSVTTIEQWAFFGCSGLTDVTVGWAMPLSVPNDIFIDNTYTIPPINLPAATLHVPSGTKALYQAHAVWGQFGTIVEATSAYTLSVSPDSLGFVASGEQQSFAIISDTDWTVSSNVSWLAFSQASGSNNAAITVAAVANPDTIQRTATITVSGTGATSQTISVTQAAKVTVIPEETEPVGEDGNGKIEIGLSLPEDATITGSFEITFPEGMTLDEALTVLSIELQGNFYLSFTYKGNNTWLIEIKSNGLRSASASEYRKIMDIAYKVAPTVPIGSYDTKITNLDLMMSNGIAIQEDLLTVPIHVLQSVNIDHIRNTPFYGFITGNTLKVESPHEEQITVYSTMGVSLYSEMKSAGSVEIPVSLPAGSIIFVRGSVSGTIKVAKGSF